MKNIAAENIANKMTLGEINELNEKVIQFSDEQKSRIEKIKSDYENRLKK